MRTKPRDPTWQHSRSLFEFHASKGIGSKHPNRCSRPEDGAGKSPSSSSSLLVRTCFEKENKRAEKQQGDVSNHSTKRALTCLLGGVASQKLMGVHEYSSQESTWLPGQTMVVVGKLFSFLLIVV